MTSRVLPLTHMTWLGSCDMTYEMDFSDLAWALRSNVSIRLLQILIDTELSSIDAYRKYNEQFSDKKHRESIHRDLELLVTCEMLEKKYNEKRKEIVYALKYPELKINLRSGEVSMI